VEVIELVKLHHLYPRCFSDCSRKGSRMMMDQNSYSDNTNISSDFIGPVLFLDIDGVLNDETFLQRCKSLDQEIDPKKVSLLNHIINKTGCRTILSSSWRSQGLNEVQRKLEKVGFNHQLDGCTPLLEERTPGGIFFAARRGDEIGSWIYAHGGMQTKAVCILDDEDVSPLEQHRVPCSFSKGLTDHEANLAIKKLLRGNFAL